MMVLAFLLMALAGCKVKRVTEKSPLLNLGENALKALIEDQRFHFETLNAKLDVNTQSRKQSASFKTNLRVKSDSAIWMSITPALGIEAIRVLIDVDSLRYIDKLNNQYFHGSLEVLDTLLDYPAEFKFLNNLLVGNAVEMEKEEKYNSYVDGLYYVLQTKNKRKLRKSVDISSVGRDSTSVDIVKDKKLQKTIEKYSDEDLIIKRYYIRPGDFRIYRTVIEDILMVRTIQIEYSQFEIVNNKAFPMHIVIEIINSGEMTKFELTYTRIKLDEPQSYPFRIPEKYTRIG